MRIYLVRHARAEARGTWTGEDLLRPLSAVGLEQAKALADELAGESISRIVCDPALRCQQTVEKLACERGLVVDVDDRLACDEPVQRTLELLPEQPEEAIVLCTHAEVVTSMLRFFELPAGDGEARCRKGDMWMLDGPGRGIATATYIEPRRRASRAAVEAARPESVRAAVLDLGSTSFNLLIADVYKNRTIVPVVREKVMLRLGAVIASNGKIPDDVAERAVGVARDLRVVAEREKVQHWLPVATSAIRDAKNGASLARRIGRAMGTPVRILSGKQEARFIFRAFQERLDLGHEPALGLDLGGGSLEIAIGNDESIDFETTLPLGVARLASEFADRDPIKKSCARKIRKRVREALEPHVDAIAALAPQRAIAAGGTIRALDRLIREGEPVPAGVMCGAALSELTTELVASTHEARLSMRGIRKARADLLPTGALIYDTLAEVLGLDEIAVCDWGLREGVLLEAVPADAKR